MHFAAFFALLFTLFAFISYAEGGVKGSFYTDTTIFRPKPNPSDQNRLPGWMVNGKPPPHYPNADLSYKRYRGRGINGPSSSRHSKACTDYNCSVQDWGTFAPPGQSGRRWSSFSRQSDSFSPPFEIWYNKDKNELGEILVRAKPHINPPSTSDHDRFLSNKLKRMQQESHDDDIS
jgi:hypothetical protein